MNVLTPPRVVRYYFHKRGDASDSRFEPIVPAVGEAASGVSSGSPPRTVPGKGCLMKSAGRNFILFIAALTIASFVPPASVSGQAPPPPPKKTLFSDIPKNDPKRQVIQEVLTSPRSTMRSQFSSGEWTTGHYGGAWGRAQQYFPNHAYFTESDQFFMTHFFNPNGKLEMEIYNSAVLNQCLANRRTFTTRSIVGEYNRMLGSDPAAARSFQEKMGRLEPYFRDEASKQKLRRMLGDRLYNQLLNELRKENHHLLAGALLHEGMHAEMDDDKLVNRIQSEYKACNLPVQWDELRAYMAEINYHSQFYRWAVGDINSHWRDISDLLSQLEGFRNRKKPLSEADKRKIEEIKAKIKAHIALIRLRIRELWQSAQRMNGLMGHFKTEYLKPDAPDEDRDMIDKITAQIVSFVKDVGDAIKQTEQLLRDLEHILDLWNEWASCKLPDPPEKKLTEDLLKDVPKIKWPAPPGPQAEEIKKKAEREIGKIPGTLPGEMPGGPPGSGPGRTPGGRSTGGGGFRQGFVVSGNFVLSSPSLKSVNDYISYLNGTWNGDVSAFGAEYGFQISLGWRFIPWLEAGAFFERTSGKVSGSLEAVPSQYTSRHTLSAVGITVGARSAPLLSVVRLVGRAGAGYYMAAYRETEDGFVTEGNDRTFGWSAAAGVDISLSGNLSVTATGGYRSVVLDDFGVSFFRPGSPPVVLEFSGFVAQAGLAFRF